MTMLATAALVLAAAARAGDPDRLLAAVPEDALFVALLADVDETRARAAKNAWCGLARDAELRPFVARASELVEEALRAAEAEGEASEDAAGEPPPARAIDDPRKWLAALHGPAVVFAAEHEGAFGFGVLVDPGEDPAALDALLEELEATLAEDGAESSQDYRGVELALYESSEVAGEDASDLAIAFEVAGLRALVGGDRRALVLELAQGAIDRLLGEDDSPGFSRSAALEAARRGGPDGRALEAFFDAGRFARMAVAERERTAASTGTPNPEAQKVLAAISASGVDELEYVHLSAAFGEGERFELRLALDVAPDSLIQRGLALLRPAPRELLAFAPAGAAATLGSLDVGGLWRFVKDVVGTHSPESAQELTQGVAMFDAMTGVALEQELLPQITGEFFSIAVALPPEEVGALADVAELGEDADAEALLSYGQAWAARVADGDEAGDILGRLLRIGGIGEQLEESEYQGHTVQSLAEDGVGMHWCVTDELLVFSTTPTPLRAILARVSNAELPSLRKDPRALALLDANPNSSYLALNDARTTAEQLVNMAGFLVGLLAADEADAELAEGLAELVELLPDPSFVARHLEGLLYQAVDVEPERLLLRFGGR